MRVEARLGGDIDQDLAIARIATVREVCGEQRTLQVVLMALDLRPVQQPMRIECVVDAGAFVHVECETKLGTPRPNVFLAARELLRRGAVLLRDVLCDVLPFRRHLRIELEWLKVNIRTCLITDALQRLLERSKPDHAPRAGNIGNEVDLETRGHGIAHHPIEDSACGLCREVQAAIVRPTSKHWDDFAEGSIKRRRACPARRDTNRSHETK
jgi:hypothetical protein